MAAGGPVRGTTTGHGCNPCTNGGTLVEDVTEVPGQGRYVLVRDPEGSEIALWQSGAG